MLTLHLMEMREGRIWICTRDFHMIWLISSNYMSKYIWHNWVELVPNGICRLIIVAENWAKSLVSLGFEVQRPDLPSRVLEMMAEVLHLFTSSEPFERSGSERIKIDDKQGFGLVGCWLGLTNWTAPISSTSCSREWGGEVNKLYNFHTIISITPISAKNEAGLVLQLPPLDPPDTQPTGTQHILRAQRRQKQILAELKK